MKDNNNPSGEQKPGYQGKINTYTCPKGHVTVTIDTDDGVTPFMIRCRQHADHAEHNCTEAAKSAGYRCDQKLTPEYEWFRPQSLEGLSPAMKHHVQQGGLEIRKIVYLKTQTNDTK
jgi:hypothetical protein